MTVEFTASDNVNALTPEQFGEYLHAKCFGLEPRPFDPRATHRWGKEPMHQECLIEAIGLQKTYPFDPMKPTGFITRLVKTVKDNLPPELREQLGVYCSLWTRYDYLCGVDGFFALQKNLLRPSTFDIATWEHVKKRGEALKAHRVVTLRTLECYRELTWTGQDIANDLVALYGEKRRWKHRARRIMFADQGCTLQIPGQ